MGDPGTGELERILKTDLWQYARRRRQDGPYADNLDIDVLIVGAGFGGMYCLYEMRKAGYSTVLYDAGTSWGGTWRWNVCMTSHSELQRCPMLMLVQILERA